jgi:hypothetical protein
VLVEAKPRQGDRFGDGGLQVQRSLPSHEQVDRARRDLYRSVSGERPRTESILRPSPLFSSRFHLLTTRFDVQDVALLGEPPVDALREPGTRSPGAGGVKILFFIAAVRRVSLCTLLLCGEIRAGLVLATEA